MQSVVSGGLRLTSLSLRMMLMLFMARYLSFADIGVFSLMVGTTALLPGAAGLGLSYYVNRDVVGGRPDAAYLLARDRLLVTFACGILSAVGVAALAAWGVLDLAIDLPIFGAIIVLEMLGFDLQLLLIARHRAGLANFLLFLRAAAWVPFFMAFALAMPALRDVGTLLWAWLAGEVACIVAAAIFLRHVVRRAILLQPFDVAWLRRQFPRVLPIWLSDFSLALGQTLDRFIISLILGVEATGVYFFFFSIGSAAFQIVQSAMIQPFMPRMREVFRSGTGRQLVTVVRACLRRVAGSAALIVGAAGAGSVVLVQLLGRAELHGALFLVLPVMIGMWAKSINECLGIVDYVTENDVRYIALNVAALVVTALLLAPATYLLGLAGAALSFVATMGGFALLRWTIWRREARAAG